MQASETVGSEGSLSAESVRQNYSDDPFLLFGDALTKGRTIWMKLTYPFSGFGERISIHHSCEIRRAAARRIDIGDLVYLAPEVWLNVPDLSMSAPAIVLGSGCRIGRRCMISAKNFVCLEDDVMLGPSVLVTDHSHQFSDTRLPIHSQGLTEGGKVTIERNCWLGHGAAVVCTQGELVVGRNSVIGVNTVVTRSVPAYSIVAGNPARIVRRYDSESGTWVRGRSLL